MGPARPAEDVVPLRKRVQRVRRRCQAVVVHALAAVVLRLPYGLTRATSRVIVTPLLALVLGRRARRNLQAALGGSLTVTEQKRVLRETFRGTAMIPAECAAWWRRGAAFFERWVDDREARERLAAFERRWPGGWIGVTGHLGNWELLGQWMALHSRVIGNVARRQVNPFLDPLVESFRGRDGVATLYRDEPMQRLLRILRDRGAIGTVPDQDISTLAGAFIPFLGRIAYTPIGPARLAVAAGVPILVAAMLRTDDGFRVHIGEPVFPDSGRPKAAEVDRLTRAWSEQLEELIRRHPEQWPWFHERWKTTPERLAARGRSPFPSAEN